METNRRTPITVYPILPYCAGAFAQASYCYRMSLSEKSTKTPYYGRRNQTAICFYLFVYKSFVSRRKKKKNLNNRHTSEQNKAPNSDDTEIALPREKTFIFLSLVVGRQLAWNHGRYNVEKESAEVTPSPNLPHQLDQQYSARDRNSTRIRC